MKNLLLSLLFVVAQGGLLANAPRLELVVTVSPESRLVSEYAVNEATDFVAPLETSLALFFPTALGVVTSERVGIAL